LAAQEPRVEFTIIAPLLSHFSMIDILKSLTYIPKKNPMIEMMKTKENTVPAHTLVYQDHLPAMGSWGMQCYPDMCYP
jgi:hypothetical protein